MFCKFCGYSLEKGNKFCTNCGKLITEELTEESKLLDQEQKNKTTNGSQSNSQGSNQNSNLDPIRVEDPIDNSQRILVRNTVTGFEQAIAALIGFFTAGPIGSLVAWGALRGVQGKWTPWILIGIPASIVINLMNLMVILVISAFVVAVQEEYSQIESHQIYLTILANTKVSSIDIKQKIMVPHKKVIELT
tara:strand:- start:6154 stop:6726 length:573 start_codon:yes stop_codon:yes gene_type:complete